MKRIISAITAMVLLLSVAVSSVAYAKAEPTLEISSAAGYAGDQVTINVSLKNSPGFGGIAYDVKYDNTKLKLISYTKDLGSSICTDSGMERYPDKMNFQYSGISNIEGDGVLVSLTFELLDVEPTSTRISVIPEEGTIFYYVDRTEVDFNLSDAYGEVTINKKPVLVAGFALDKTNVTVETGDETLTLTPIFSPADATNKNLTWTSSDNEIATVADGVVTLIKKGVVTITAATEDGEYTASCVVTINCSHRCGDSYPAESSTCIKQGHEAYDVCGECGEIINGSDAKLPFADHTYVEKADAQYLKTAATCNSKAVYYKSCSVCGVQSNVSFFEYGEFNSNNHVGGTYKANQKEATCNEEGYTGDTYCSECNTKLETGTVIEKNTHNPASVWSTDENYHWKNCQTVGCGNIIDKAAHTGGEATCAKKASCSVCGVEYGAVNADNHKNTEVRDALDASCTTDGCTGDTYCKDCGIKISVGAVIPAGHKLDKVDAKAATHETDGNIEYYKCLACNRLFADRDAIQEIALEDTIITKGEHNYGDTYQTDAENHWKECGCGSVVEKAAHDFGDWSVVKEATALDAGLKERSCSICGYKASENIPAVGAATEPSNPDKAPQTGDAANLALWILLMFVSATGIGAVTVYNRKSVQNKLS